MSFNTIVDLLSILAAGLVAALICRRLKISAIVGYLIIGALLGAGVLDWAGRDNHDIEAISEAGVFLLLFSIGLEFSLDDLLRLGRQLVVGGSVQMALVAVPAGLIFQALGYSLTSSIVMAAALSFSSTVLVFNALVEYGESSTPHGKRAIGILLFQDMALVPLLLLVPMLTGDAAPSIGDVFRLAAASLLFVGLILVSRYVLAGWLIPSLANYRSPDIIILFTVVALGGITLTAHALGLPAAVGAFAAGLAFGGNRWSAQIEALTLPFRETFAAVFFVSLGLLLDTHIVLESPLRLLLLIAAVILLKAIAACLALRLTGLSWRSSLGIGIGLAHIGEFAFVLTRLAWQEDVISAEEYQLMNAVAIGSLILTPLLLRAGLRWVEAVQEQEAPPPSNGLLQPSLAGALVIGIGPIGKQIASYLETQGIDVSLIDRSPINLYPFEQLGFHTAAGDATKPEILRSAHTHEAGLVVLCVPDDLIALRILEQVRRLNDQAQIIVRCRYQSSVASFHKAKVQFVVSEEQQAYESMIGFLSGFFRSS
ncbi:cation:proton antiporter [Bythopirellula goksoeyrii]|uniref:Inner membrane protein YbaL n=1 Tax=Bythopirellula goksoeyrii TaxID=1400387 RepID=A0A5B9QII2_9BACT|nr:cation:proton antiporter [Bythopirellula goksoeyrii]QEG36826.1 Inner membrane protein YbaL [Bythopirellula goksoeyrii]